MYEATIQPPLVAHLKKFEQPMRIFFLMATAALAAQLPVGPVLGVLTVSILFWFVFRFPGTSFLLLVGLVPFLHLTIDFSSYAWSAHVPILGSLDAPAADFLALFLLIAAGIRTVFGWAREKMVHAGAFFPGLLWYAPFFITGALSLSSVSSFELGASFKYLIHPILFSYLAYVCLPAFYIASPALIARTIKVIIGTVTAAGLYGLLSLFVVSPFWGVWRRVTPFALGPFTPLGTNHNQLSEVLTTFLPLAVFAAVHTATAARKRLYAAAAMVIAAAALLSFGRAAWLTLVVEAALFVWITRPRLLTAFFKRWWPAALIGGVLAMYMVVFSLSAFVQTGTDTRLDLSRLAWQLFAASPTKGSGVGTFLGTVRETRAFTVEYGDPVEAHGFVQKIGAEMGIAGLFTFLLFISWVLYRIVRAMQRAHRGNTRDLLLAALIMVVGGITFQLFNTSYYSAKLWLPIGLALVIVEAAGARRIEQVSTFGKTAVGRQV